MIRFFSALFVYTGSMHKSRAGIGPAPSLLKNDRGAAAIEFGLIAPVFFAFVLAIIDVSAYFFVAGQLQHGVTQASRLIRTSNNTVTIAGATQTFNVIGSNSAARNQFRNAVCAHLSSAIIQNCTSDLRVDVRSFSGFSAATLPANLDANNDGTITDGETSYTSGGPSCPVIARVFYKYNSLIPGMPRLLAAVVPGTSYVSAAFAFRNEPYSSGAAAACP